ncbi:13103_t:CDS:2, partial [Ambispora leptoticha]
TAIGLRVNDGVVLAVEKLVQSKLLVPGSNRRIQTVDMHIGVATAGLLADGRHIINRARDEAENYKDVYHSPIPGKVRPLLISSKEFQDVNQKITVWAHIQTIADRVGQYVQAYTLYSSARPFGSSAIIGTVDKDGPQLFMVEPSGVYWGYHGCAIGKGKQVAKTEIEKLKLSEMTALEAVKEATRIIYTVHDDAKDKEFELELSWVTNDSKRHEFVPTEIALEAERLAKETLNEEMEDD